MQGDMLINKKPPLYQGGFLSQIKYILFLLDIEVLSSHISFCLAGLLKGFK